jgi:hypothetical protein
VTAKQPLSVERLASAMSALREMAGYSVDDLMCCLAEDPSTFQYVGDLLASHDALEARVRELEVALRLLLEDVRFVHPDEPHEREIPCHHRVDTIRQAWRATGYEP